MSSILLQDPRDFDEIEDMLRTEPGLTYQLIELASVGRMGETARRVNSLRQAMVLVGSWRIQTWMAMLLAHPRGHRTDGAMTGALARARACEVLARPLGQSTATLGFTGGMISSFEELTAVPREELQQTLALSEELRDAAFGDETPLGRLVTDVAERQEGRPEPRRLSGRPLAEIEAALAAGYEWAGRASAAIG
jgi:c-di-GMP phosphodiesterase